MKVLLSLLGMLLPFVSFSQIDSAQVIADQYQYLIDSIESQLSYQHGEVELEGGMATLNIPEGYKFLGPEQSSYVLTDLWGNPPEDVLGLLFPEDVTPLSDNFTYAVEVTYSEEGFIDDDEAEDLDYDDLLEQMQDDANEINKEREKQGYVPVELVGWASPPFYDKESKKLHWAKELKFGDTEGNTLNYNIRILGRNGYLNMNAIGQMTVLPEFQKDIDGILASVEFNDGYKYTDFDPEFDKVAAYGIGGLITGKILAKAGFFALIAKFWKIIAVAVVGFFGTIRKKLFGSKEEN